MKLHVKAATVNRIESDVWTLLVTHEGWKQDLHHNLPQLAKDVVSHLEHIGFEAKASEVQLVPTFGKINSRFVCVAGIGDKEKVHVSTVREVVATLVRQTTRNKLNSVVIDFSVLNANTGFEGLSQAAAEGAFLGSYTFDKYKSAAKKSPSAETNVYLVVPPNRLQFAANGVKKGEIFAKATMYARDLVNESPTITTPTFLAEQAKKLSKKDVLTVEILNEAHIRKLGMGAYLSVTRGSDEPAKFMVMTYKGGGKKKIVLAGKAITFDTGGLSLKDAKNMETMKLDMAGGAAVLGVMSMLPILKPKVTVVGLIAACENMPGAKATKPGDIATAFNGTTIEILNTDAEGRLTLADVLSYAVTLKPDMIIDLATLTGACMVALGEEIAGVFSNSEDLTKSITAAAKQAGELVWSLPLEEAYRESVKSDIADLRNIAKTRYGGAITAALFLEEFVGQVPWAHLDIAGPAFEEKGSSLRPKGGTGFGVRLLLELLTTFK